MLQSNTNNMLQSNNLMSIFKITERVSLFEPLINGLQQFKKEYACLGCYYFSIFFSYKRYFNLPIEVINKFNFNFNLR